MEIVSLLHSLKDQPPDTARRIIKGRAEVHFRRLKMEDTLAPYKGRTEAFLEFLSKEWGWRTEYDRKRGVIEVDENKSYCVCPLSKDKKDPGLGVLCYCSEGFNEAMFSLVVGRKVRAEVVRSILRGAGSCRYRITIV